MKMNMTMLIKKKNKINKKKMKNLRKKILALFNLNILHIELKMEFQQTKKYILSEEDTTIYKNNQINMDGLKIKTLKVMPLT